MLGIYLVSGVGRSTMYMKELSQKAGVSFYRCSKRGHHVETPGAPPISSRSTVGFRFHALGFRI